MRPIVDFRVSLVNGVWRAKCVCGRMCGFATKATALRMLGRGSCRNCKKDYRAVIGTCSVYKNDQGAWCSVCSGCGNEQAYTRKDHAKQSEIADWRCKKCVSRDKGYSENKPKGASARLYNKFRKSANSRGIFWGINLQQFTDAYSGRCALTGWPISMEHGTCTASLDRVDSTKGYLPDNIQWVHSMVNMCKNKYDQTKFIAMCNAVSDRVKW